MSALSVCLALLAGLGLASAAQAESYLIGVLDFAGAEHSFGHWQATGAALNAALPGDEFVLVPMGLEALGDALGAGEIAFVITNPGNYAELEYRYHASRLATAEGDMPVASTLVTAGDLADLGDLAGRRLAIVSREAFGGFQVIWREMASRDAGLPGQVTPVVTGFPMQAAAQAVLAGEADAAVLRACLLEEWQEANPARWGALHAFAVSGTAEGCAVSSRVYPGWPFAKAAGTDPALAKQVAVALLGMKVGNLWTVPLDYQPVHELMRELRIGPYARSGPVSIGDFVQDYRDWIIAVAVALAFWAMYSVRVEMLVRRRTRALSEANADLSREMAERQRAEAADRQHQRELEHVARLSILGEMASSIAHELNQPLSAIATYAQGMTMRLKAGRVSTDEMQTASDEIAAQAVRAATVIRRIRAFVRKRESQLSPVDIGELVTESAALFEAATHRAGVRLEMDLAADLPQVRADRVQLQQMVLNLVQNAIDAMAETPPGARVLTIAASQREDARRGAGVCLSVHDRGVGLSPEGLARFAEAFHTTKPDGIGLGLALSRSIVEAHGGWMRAETPEDGVGLKVSVWLPIGGADG